MRRSVRVYADVGPEARLASAIATLSPQAQDALVVIADREDLPLVAGAWGDDHGGCLVSNVVAALTQQAPAGQTAGDRTVDMRLLDLLPEISSRDLNRLVVAWDEAAMQERTATDPTLRRLLRGALARAGVTPTRATQEPRGMDGHSVVGAHASEDDLDLAR